MEEGYGTSSSDRGGSRELICLMKKDDMPIICSANDNSFPNMKPLAKIYLRTRFADPQCQQ